MDTITEKNSLLFTPPPVNSWRHPLFEKAGLTVDVLRLDLMHPVIGGNKWIKLKGFLKRAVTNGKAGILTKGGPWSNHVHACAWMCHEFDLACTAWVKGYDRITNAMLKDVAKWNTTIRFVNRTEFYDENKAIQFAADNNLLYIPMGGAEEMGTQQVCQFIQALHLPFYQYAICAVGTATTLGGVALVPDNFSNIIGMDAGTGDELVKQKIVQWQQSLAEKIVSLIADDGFGGFARHTPALITFMNELFASYQIPTDIVYTGKLFYALLNLVIANYFPEGARLLVVHSGGLQGNRSLPAGTLEF